MSNLILLAEIESYTCLLQLLRCFWVICFFDTNAVGVEQKILKFGKAKCGLKTSFSEALKILLLGRGFTSHLRLGLGLSISGANANL